MKKVAALLVLALASAALVACGGGNSTTTTSTSTGGEAGGGAAAGGGGAEAGGGNAAGGGSVVALEADPNGQLAYTTDQASAKAGQVTVEFENPQALSHDVAIEGSSGTTVGKTELVAEGSAVATVNLKPGTYHYYCTVPGHREAGMEGTLTVK
jgi:plastocyanin